MIPIFKVISVKNQKESVTYRYIGIGMDQSPRNWYEFEKSPYRYQYIGISISVSVKLYYVNRGGWPNVQTSLVGEKVIAERKDIGLTMTQFIQKINNRIT